MNLDYYFDEFIDYLKAEKDVSHYTVTNYTSDFKQFLNFLRVNGIQPKLNTITTPIIRRYLAHLKTDKKYAVETIRRRVHCLSSYYKFLMEQEYIIKNPMLAIHAPKSPETIPKFLSTEEIELLMQMPDKY